MISFVKFVAVFSAACLATTAIVAKTDDGSTPKPEGKEGGDKKKKKGKADAEKKPVDVPVVKGHDSFGLGIPYFDSSGKRDMNFKIGVASRIDENHVQLKDLQIETFNDEGKHEMAIDVPTSVLNTETSEIRTDKHVTIRRSDFELTGESMIFNAKTKLGGLGGNVRMVIYNLQEETGGDSDTDDSKKDADHPKKADPSKESAPDTKANTPKAKAK